MNSRVLLFISKGVSYVGTKKAILICFEFVYFEVHGIKALFQYFTLGKLTKRRTSNKKMYVYKNKEIKKSELHEKDHIDTVGCCSCRIYFCNNNCYGSKFGRICLDRQTHYIGLVILLHSGPEQVTRRYQ